MLRWGFYVLYWWAPTGQLIRNRMPTIEFVRLPRVSPWLGHLMVSRQETARPLLTPGEVMRLPNDDELVLVSGCQPIHAKKPAITRMPS
jgi:hypothetical protein